jgi:hypothetical protein
VELLRLEVLLSSAYVAEASVESESEESEGVKRRTE